MILVRVIQVLVLVLLIFHTVNVAADEPKHLLLGVVKITSSPPEESAKVGTGFIVRLESDAAYIVTAAHVIAGDMQPQVEFFTKRNVSVPAEVLGAEGGDEVRGLALLVVRGREKLPPGLTAMPVAPGVRLSGGEEIIIIGFPRGAGPWAIIRGSIVSRRGRDIDFAAALDEGNSGGPILKANQVVGMVAGLGRSYGRGVPAMSVYDFLDGFGITPEVVMEVPKDKPYMAEKAPVELKGEIIGIDGALMVLVPAGIFSMESKGGIAKERSGHQIYLDSFYIDKYEVTVDQYKKFLQATGRDH